MASSTRLLRPETVRELTTLSRTTMHEMIKAGTFPRPLKIGRSRIAWPEKEIDDWIAARTPSGSGALPQVEV